MDCLEFRRRVGAEPASEDAGAAAHEAGCAACARYRGELRAIDSLIGRALAIDPALIRRRERAVAAGATPPARRRFLAIAASVTAGLAVGIVLLVSAPRASIAREVALHVTHEPAALVPTTPLPPAALAAALDPDGTRLRPGIGDVTFAARCLFEGRVVPHLVVRTQQGPVTVLMLRHRDVDEAMRVERDGLGIVVLPAPRGSLAVVGNGVTDLDAVARKVFESVDWGS